MEAMKHAFTESSTYINEVRVREKQKIFRILHTKATFFLYMPGIMEKWPEKFLRELST